MHKPIKPRMGRKKSPLAIFCRPIRGLKYFGPADPRFHRGLLSAAPPTLGPAGFESHAKVMKTFEPVGSTTDYRRDKSTLYLS